MAASACSKSASKSRQSSIPTDTRTRPSVTPDSASSCALMPECVVLLGWHVSVSTPPKETASTPERGCRPSLSNGYKCPVEGRTGANQYSTETLARARCPTGTVVWANTRSNVYHFRGTYNYGNTKAGAYMCEQDSLAEGMRAAKNEKHP